MKTIKSSKDITTLEVGDVVVFGDLSHTVKMLEGRYYLCNATNYTNDRIIKDLRIDVPSFNKKLGIKCEYDQEYSACNAFPEYYSLEALTAIVSALFKEYEKQNELPKTWDEFCDNYPVTNKEAILSHNSVIITFEDFPNPSTERDPDVDRNFCTSLKEAEAFLALIQLRQLRKCYVGDWEPDWTNCRTAKFSITCIEGELTIFDTVTVHRSMSFPNSNLAKQFFNNFKDLLEIAKPLL